MILLPFRVCNEIKSRAEKFSTLSHQHQQPPNSLPFLLTRSWAIFSSFQGAGEREREGAGEGDDTNPYKRVEEEGEKEEEKEGRGEAWALSG